ncbi:M20 family metallopeptidase [Brevibacterium sp. UBA7493]|uniref:M20 family metallopeptidase n=1 Tax=Brevibacterium sp. UBA7493 TaxID=1946121 RepID=UPI00257B5ED5|nr:M20 family metallopeptidase [Brevibacterium sp. UBA7493]
MPGPHPAPGSQPTVPDPTYLNLLKADMAARAAAANPPGSAFTGAPVEATAEVRAAVDALAPQLLSLASDIYGYAELAFEEYRSAGRIAAQIEAAGIDVERGAYGLDTALCARFGPSTGRTIGICAEYDGLPDIGHACGHNVIAATGVGAFLAIARAYAGREDELPGQVVLLGTPAEEGHTGKEYMAQAGAFEDLDAAIMLHPAGYDAADVLWIGRRLLDVEFTGVAAHASAQPFMGRNALDAASLLYQGIGLVRQQMLPIDRVHAAIPEGGDRPSIITESARVSIYVRSAEPATLMDLSQRVEDIARGAALMTGCGVEVRWDKHPPSMPVRANQALTGRWSVRQQERGRAPLPRGVVSDSLAASTDFGNVSYLVPGIHPMLRIADAETALHTRGFAQAAASEAAETGVLDGTYGLAGVALDYLFDDALAEAVRQEFEDAGGVLRVSEMFG